MCFFLVDGNRDTVYCVREMMEDEMRVKVGNEWYEAKPGQPIMVELLPGDKENIANMHPDATKYALFDDPEMSADEKRAWMETLS